MLQLSGFNCKGLLLGSLEMMIILCSCLFWGPLFMEISKTEVPQIQGTQSFGIGNHGSCLG